MNIISELERVDDLPTIPTSLARIMQIVQNPNAEFYDLVGAVESDQSLATKILKVANSPFFGCTRTVENLERAVSMIGFNEVRNIAIGLTAFQTLHRRSGTVRFERDKFWRHSYACGFVSHFISESMGFGNQEYAFVGGLIHDIGKVTLDSYFPRQFAAVLEDLSNPPNTFIASELRTLDVGHDEVGRFICNHWKLPEDICSGVGGHHNPKNAKHPLAYLIFLANHMVHQLDYHSANTEEWIEPELMTEDENFIGVREWLGIDMATFFDAYIDNLQIIQGLTTQLEGMA